MTKCIVIGKELERKGKPIQFVKSHRGNKEQNNLTSFVTAIPSYWKNIELIMPAYWKNIELIMPASSNDYFDIMFAYDTDRTRGAIFFGYWNDGYVER